MISAWLKLAHIAGLTIWCAGLLMLPVLFRMRAAGDTGQSLWRLQRFARAAFIRIVSPAAFVAIGTGTALIFVEEVFTAWFALKLAAVGVLVAVHARVGYLVVEVYKPDGRYAFWRQAAMQGIASTAMFAVLWLVLAKPVLDFDVLPEWFHRPGGLHSASERLMPIP
ncbi:MAG TPA: CopD family protein [Methylomirabilota bacterium]|nr:CopD family protein [Methylomirabilota bacterium]